MAMAKVGSQAKPKPLVVLPFVPKVFAVRPRLTASIATGVITGAASALIAPELRLSTHLILGWDALALAFIGSMLASMVAHGPDDIRLRAARDDEGRAAILALVLLAAVASFGATGLELHLAKQTHGIWKAGEVALAFGTVVASWTMMQLIFAIHYAHAYYDAHPDTPGVDSEGLLFPGGEPPDYWDFLHFAMVIGVASQTADIAFTSKGQRRLGTLHSLVAFSFNTLIVALTINLVAGLF